MNAHVDVAAYALGALDEQDASRFEEHLAECPDCATELESMLPVVALMSDVNVADLVDPGPAFGEAYDEPVEPGYDDRLQGGMPEPGLRAVGSPVRRTGRSDRSDGRAERLTRSSGPGLRPLGGDRPQPRRRRGRTVLGLAAAASVLGVLTAGGVLAPDRWFGPSSGGTTSAEPSPSTGTQQQGGDRLQATDADTGVRADVVLSGEPWGTRVSFEVSKVEGPRTCRLVAVSASGEEEIVSTWNVPERGYGTDEQPKALSLQAATAMSRDDIAELQVQEIEADGSTKTLVTVES